MNKLANGAELGSALTAEELELARLIVSTLNLDARAEEIDPVAPLYGEGLGLDSIDILEVALAVSKTYGVKLRADDDGNRDRKSTRLNSSHLGISYAVFC